MNKKLLLSMILCLVLLPSVGWGVTRTMSGCSQAAFNTVYGEAASGDTIAFPDGACSITWSGTSAIAKTNITILGKGIGTTIINGGAGRTTPVFSVTGSTGNGLRITAIDFRGPGGSEGFVFQSYNNGSQVVQNIRIDNNRFYNWGVVTQWGSAESTSGAVPVNCVVDNNNFDTPTYSTSYVWADCDDTTLFPFSLGTSSGVYFEDNTIHAENGDMDHFITGRCGMRSVLRYNTFYLYAWDAIDMHDSYEGGGRSNAKRGSWTMEIYNNKFIFEGRNSGAREINLRGGQAVIYSNYSDSTSSGWITLQSYNQTEGSCTAAQCNNQTVCSDGRYCDHINATYIWSNKYNCGADMTNCAAGSNLTSINTDASVTLNTHYWMSAMPGYVAYTYPHPLRGEGGDTTAPTVTITTNSGSNYSTSTRTINLAGTSSDDVLVSSIAWSCTTCTPTSGSASGTTSWTITSGQLALGANTITVTATDSSSNTGNDSIVITYSPPSAQGCEINGTQFRN